MMSVLLYRFEKSGRAECVRRGRESRDGGASSLLQRRIAASSTRVIERRGKKTNTFYVFFFLCTRRTESVYASGERSLRGRRRARRRTDVGRRNVRNASVTVYENQT